MSVTAGHNERSVYNVRTLELVVRKRCFQPLRDVTVTWGEGGRGSNTGFGGRAHMILGVKESLMCPCAWTDYEYQ